MLQSSRTVRITSALLTQLDPTPVLVRGLHELYDDPHFNHLEFAEVLREIDSTQIKPAQLELLRGIIGRMVDDPGSTFVGAVQFSNELGLGLLDNRSDPMAELEDDVQAWLTALISSKMSRLDPRHRLDAVHATARLSTTFGWVERTVLSLLLVRGVKGSDAYDFHFDLCEADPDEMSEWGREFGGFEGILKHLEGLLAKEGSLLEVKNIVRS